MSHAYHPNASARTLLSPTCEDCRSKILGALDDDHLFTLTGFGWRELDSVLPPELRGPIRTINAMSVQAEHLERTGEAWPVDAPA